MLAISKPGEDLPPAGASRATAASQWQDTVLEMLGKTALVIITLGSSRSVRWEIEHVIERVPPERVLLLTLVDESSYLDARLKLGSYFPKGLPSYPFGKRLRKTPITAAIWFQPDWTPVAVRLDSVPANLTHPLESALVYELRPVYEAIGAQWPGLHSPTFQRNRMTRRGAESYALGCLFMMLVIDLNGRAGDTTHDRSSAWPRVFPVP